MAKQRRPIDWFLGTLAVGTAVAALLRKRPEPSGTGAAPPSDPGVRRTRKQWAGSLVRTIRQEIRDDETIIIAAAISFYALLALFATAVAAVSIYALVLDPADLADQIATITDVLPDEVKSLVSSQIERLAETSPTGVSVSLAASALGALWVSSGGTRALLHGINLVYNATERRPWLIQRAIAYGLTLAFIVFGLSTIAVVTFLPGWLKEIGLGSTGVSLVEVLRWPTILVVVVVGLMILYRIGPNRPNSPDRRLAPGAIIAAVLWLAATLGFSVFTGSGVSSFDSGTYGALVGAVVLLVWLFISGFVILLGAEINASLESAEQR